MSLQNLTARVDEMAHWVKATATIRDDLDSIPRTTNRKESPDSRWLFLDLHPHAVGPSCKQVNIKESISGLRRQR